ncbi:phosphoglycerate kinase [Methylocapsa polymorpha]|uniref:Phosphoglycerate kinase n=1 Tax=Methylocapsa polymorpha TaxID=3080828 RepID=A0ABZ0HTK1_9HYPH|nr:phosphoglycerate kinase [Methylocapsa sp. RX1]
MTKSVPLSPFPTLDDVVLKGKRVLVRVDLNVPMENGRITDSTRIDRILGNIREISSKGGKVIILSHLGRPKGPEPETSLKPVAVALEYELGRMVSFASDCVGDVAKSAVNAMRDGDILLLENTRFHPGETKNDPAFVDALAELGDLYVNDAFSTAHRAHASTEGIAHKLPAFAGRTMQLELEMLTSMLAHPERPLAAIVGGAKVSTKLELLGNLMRRVDYLFIGGGMANTFLAASGKAIGKSLCELQLADVARKIQADADAANCQLVLPVDAIVAAKLEPNASVRAVDIDHVGENDVILDIGPRSISKVVGVLAAARTVVWNGPVGAFEVPPFDTGTIAIAKVAALLTKVNALETIAGGGDTIAALNKADAYNDFTYVSTAGGAFLEWLEGKLLPGVEALRGAKAAA